MNKIKLIENHSEIGAGTRGSSLGVDAMKIASINAESELFAKYPSEKIPTENHILFKKSKPSFAKNIKQILKVYENLTQTIRNTFNENYFPVILTGDHSNAAGTIAGIKATFPEKRLGVIWVDAHADLHSPYTTPSGNVHGMPLAISLNEDNLDRKSNNVKGATLEDWENLKNFAGIAPKVNYEDLVFFGVRDTEEQEDYLMKKHNLKSYTVTDVRVSGIEKVVNETNEYLKNCDLIYVSFDVDSMDCNYVSHGTGTPVPVGFSEYEATKLLLQLLKNEKVCCFEITEVNPTLDEKRNVMAETAFRILEKSTAVLEKKKSPFTQNEQIA